MPSYSSLAVLVISTKRSKSIMYRRVSSMIPKLSSFAGLMSSDHCARLACRDCAERRHPFSSPLRIGFGEIQVRIAVSGITRNNQTDGTWRRVV